MNIITVYSLVVNIMFATNFVISLLDGSLLKVRSIDLVRQPNTPVEVTIN